MDDFTTKYSQNMKKLGRIENYIHFVLINGVNPKKHIDLRQNKKTKLSSTNTKFRSHKAT